MRKFLSVFAFLAFGCGSVLAQISPGVTDYKLIGEEGLLIMTLSIVDGAVSGEFAVDSDLIEEGPYGRYDAETGDLIITSVVEGEIETMQGEVVGNTYSGVIYTAIGKLVFSYQIVPDDHRVVTPEYPTYEVYEGDRLVNIIMIEDGVVRQPEWVEEEDFYAPNLHGSYDSATCELKFSFTKASHDSYSGTVEADGIYNYTVERTRAGGSRSVSDGQMVLRRWQP